MTNIQVTGYLKFIEKCLIDNSYFLQKNHQLFFDLDGVIGNNTKLKKVDSVLEVMAGTEGKGLTGKTSLGMGTYYETLWRKQC